MDNHCKYCQWSLWFHIRTYTDCVFWQIRLWVDRSCYVCQCISSFDGFRFCSTNVRYFSNWLAKKEYANVNALFGTSLSFYGALGLLNAIILLVISVFSNSIFNVSPECESRGQVFDSSCNK